MDNLKERIKGSISHSMNPYIAFSKKLNTKEVLDKYKQELLEAGFGEVGDLDNPEDLFEQLRDDLHDDLHNCGGSVLARIEMVSRLYPLLGEHQEDIINEMTDLYIEELESYVIE